MQNNPEKLRILFLITDLGKGGAERFLIDLCTELQKRENIEFIIAPLFDNNQYRESTSLFNIVPLHYSEFRLFHKNEFPSYRKLLDEFRPHIIHTHRFLAEFLSAFYLQKGAKYICHGHDNMVQLNKLSFNSLINKELFLNYFEKCFLIRKKYNKTNTSFISNSSHTDDYYKKVLPRFMKPDVHLIEYGFNYNQFFKKDNKPYKKGEILKLVNVGSFQDKKNQIFIVAIALELKKYRIPFEIHLLGDGANREKVQDAVNKNNLENEVFLHGNVNNVEQILWSSHIYLHTAWYEPFGLVFLEAMAAGLPVVCLDGKGNRDLIINGKNGYMIFEQDAFKFAQRIIDLSNNPGKFDAISQYAQAFSKNYDIIKSTDRLLEFYKTELENLS
ncbi:MAG: glycosyltransferase family 4 protein [Salinivirgaceae bacterium]|nr:glycosyltransferase family 4 protein [Salinivirgaceae bacterium]